MPNTRSRATMTREPVNGKINRQLAGALGARDAAKNLEPLMGNEGNGNRGNGNGNGNGRGNGYNFRGFMPAKECTYQEFLKCQPFNFNGTKGVVGLTRWFEKMEIVFHINNCLEKYQPGIVCYECGRSEHFRKDCPKLRNQNLGNQNRNKNRNKTGNQTGGNETTAKAYAIRGGGANPD
nr:reverse transcriptase domain-containing protein [Tanacetum cinerariifolium]